MSVTPYRQIRAVYTKDTIRVYQAYSDQIADAALMHGTFISPPFKTERMTWIKPSFLWMMYRSGWAKKDNNQSRILAVDITRSGFEWALRHSLLSHKAKNYSNKEKWQEIKHITPVRIQWDPERDLYLQPLEYRTIQIGLSNEAVDRYLNEWIQNIIDITDLAEEIHSLRTNNQINKATALLPNEVAYPTPSELNNHIGAIEQLP